MKTLLTSAVVALALGAAAAPASAQVYRGYGHGYDRTPSYADQYDRPGDFRCDAYWDRGRTDCHEGWRDQRRYSGYDRGGHRYGYGYGYGQGGYGQAHYGYGQTRYGYGQGYGYVPSPGTPYYGAYGRPDLVYPGRGYGGQGRVEAGRDPGRVDWCRWNYRSYDPSTGYYRAYSGRYVYCG